MNAECAKWERLTRVGVDQENLAVQDQVVPVWKRFRNEVLEMLDLRIKKND